MDDNPPPNKRSRLLGPTETDSPSTNEGFEAGAALESASNNDNHGFQQSTETTTTANLIIETANDLRSTVRDVRRNGIYGVQSLLNKSEGTNEAPEVASSLSCSTTNPGQSVDADRDQLGRKLHPILEQPSYGSASPSSLGTAIKSNRQPFRDKVFPTIPENFHTSPQRLQHASTTAEQTLKRKRPDLILPPTAYVYTRTNDPNFNIFSGFLLYPELCFALAAQLPVVDLISLYAISKDFRIIIDRRFTTVILSQSLRKAPESSRTFGFRSYAQLCRKDPAARIPHPNPRLANNPRAVRKIPSFRWLKFILYREKVVHELMAVFAESGIPLPSRCSLALKRLWFLLDIPDNARRVGFIHCKPLFNDLDLYFSMCFFVKLDMRLNNPLAVDKGDNLRRLLLGMPGGLTTILKVLKGEIWRDPADVLVAWTRYRFEPMLPLPPGQNDTIFGVPAAQAGRQQYEYWGRVTEEQARRPLQILLRPDQLVMREAIRRGLRFSKHFLRCLLYGYLRPDTLENYKPRKYGRRIEELKDEEYGFDDVVGGVGALDVDDGGDGLLDLGPVRNKEKSLHTNVKEEANLGEREMISEQERELDTYMQWYQMEKTEMGIKDEDESMKLGNDEEVQSDIEIGDSPVSYEDDRFSCIDDI